MGAGAGQPGERTFAAQPLGVVAGADQQGGAGVDADPAQGDELGRGRGDQAGELPVEVSDLGVEGAEAQRELLHRIAGRSGHGVGFVAGTELRGDGARARVVRPSSCSRSPVGAVTVSACSWLPT
jgi:hypothetical protein